MVKLQLDSNIDKKLYPFSHNWDLIVRRNYQLNQHSADKQTYHVQRLQRYWLSLRYPNQQDSQLVTLNLHKKKQMVGQVNKQQLELYQNVDSSISNHYKRTFNLGHGLSPFGIFAGGSSLLFTTYFNFTFPSRLIIPGVLLALGSFWNGRNVESEIKSSEFLDWVIQYRKSKAFAERYNHLFNDAKLKKVLGDANMVELGQQLIRMAS